MAALADRIPFVHLPSSLSPLDRAVLFEIRLPRIVLGALVGGLLSVAGAGYQGVFRNPLVDSGMLGASAGAGLGATLAIVYLGGAGPSAVPVAAFAGSLAGVAIAYLSGAVGGSGTATLLLAGVAVGLFLTAVQTYVLQRSAQDLQQVYSWLLGSLSGATWQQAAEILPYAAVSVAVVLLHGRHLDVLSVGDEEARALGLHPGRIRLIVVAACALAAASAVAVSGLIGFVGIVVPHVVRRLAGPSYRLVLPLSLLTGGGLPGPGRHPGPHRRVSRRAAHRRGHRAGRLAGVRLDPAVHRRGAHMSAIEVSELTVELDRVRILHAVNAAVSRGGWLALIGPNGAGKTTLLRAVAGLLPHRGTIHVDQTDLGALRGRGRARLIAYVPQIPVLPPDLTVEEYVLLGRTPHLGYLGAPGRSDRAKAAEASERLDVARFAGRRLGSLSGGERQRVRLARALAQEPQVLLLDEPTSDLDIGHQQQVLELVDDLRRSRGVTVVSTLHDLTQASQYAGHLVLLSEGRVEAAGAPAVVLTEDLIARVYAARVTVTTDPAGHPVVTPVRHPRAMTSSETRRTGPG